MRTPGPCNESGRRTTNNITTTTPLGDQEEMNVRPLGDKIIVKRAEAQTKTDTGIYLPESAKDKPKEGKVIALGQGLLNKDTGKYMPFTVKKGDRIIFTSYSGTEIKLDGEEYLIMTEDDILGVIEKD